MKSAAILRAIKSGIISGAIIMALAWIINTHIAQDSYDRGYEDGAGKLEAFDHEQLELLCPTLSKDQ